MISPNSEKKAKDAREAQAMFTEAVKALLDHQNQQCISIIKETVARGVNIEDILLYNAQGKTILHVACSKGAVDVVEYIISVSKHKQIILNLADDDGFTPIINATISESINLMNLLISNHISINMATKNGATALHYAASDGSIDRIEILIKNGANINSASKSGTPLHWASSHHHLDAIQYLINNGADINLSVQSVGTPIFTAAVSQDDSIVSYYLNQPNINLQLAQQRDLHLIHICAEYGLYQSITQLININPNLALLPLNDGNLPIHLAAMSKHINIIRILHLISTPEIAIMSIDDILIDGEKRLEIWNQSHTETGIDKNGDENKAMNETGNTLMDSVNSIEINYSTSEENIKKAEILKNLGNKYHIDHRYTDAIEAYSQAINLHSSNHILWSNRSASYMADNDPDNALFDALVCRRIKPDWAKASYRVAIAKMALKSYEDAAVAAFEGCKLDDKNQELKTILREAVAKGREEHVAKTSTA